MTGQRTHCAWFRRRAIVYNTQRASVRPSLRSAPSGESFRPVARLPFPGVRRLVQSTPAGSWRGRGAVVHGQKVPGEFHGANRMEWPARKPRRKHSCPHTTSYTIARKSWLITSTASCRPRSRRGLRSVIFSFGAGEHRATAGGREGVAVAHRQHDEPRDAGTIGRGLPVHAPVYATSTAFVHSFAVRNRVSRFNARADQLG